MQGGADAVSAALWPLSVDGLLLLSTVGLLNSPARSGRPRWVMWVTFWLGIVVSLAANIAAAPTPAWKPVLVAGWPPVALLFAVELLAHCPSDRREGASSGGGGVRDGGRGSGEASDALLERARRVNARHWELYQRPVSAESLRKELRIGPKQARQLVALVRADRKGSAPAARKRT